MREPRWERFLELHQYDPRQWDVEHGVLSSWFNREGLLSSDTEQAADKSFRTETLGLVRWVEQETSQYGPISFYLSGHSWDLLDAPLYLVYPNQSPDTRVSKSWTELITQFTSQSPYSSLASHAPLTEEYMLPKWGNQSTSFTSLYDGFFVLPTQAAFKDQNQNSSVRQSTMDFVYEKSPEIFACVVEPPIFTSHLFQHNSKATELDLSALLQSIKTHQTIVDQLTNTIVSLTDSPHASLQQIISSIDQPLRRFTDHYNEGDRIFIRLVCELSERQGIEVMWKNLFKRLQQDSKSPLDLLTDGQLQLARANQLFHAGNLIATSLRLLENCHNVSADLPSITSSSSAKLLKYLTAYHEEILCELAPLKLRHWPIKQSCFVYLCALSAFIEGTNY